MHPIALCGRVRVRVRVINNTLVKLEELKEKGYDFRRI